MPFSDSSIASTTHGSDSHHSSEDAHDYSRIARGAQRDLGVNDSAKRHSYAYSTGEHEEDSTGFTFDIDAGAAAMSTRRLDTNSRMLPDASPSITSKYVNTHFKDFSMCRLLGLSDESEDSIEIGRFHTAISRGDRSSTINQASIGRGSSPPKPSTNQPASLRFGNKSTNNDENINLNARRTTTRQSVGTANDGSPSLHRAKNMERNNTNVQKRAASNGSRYQPSIETDDDSFEVVNRGNNNTRFSGQPKNANAARRDFTSSKQQEATEQLKAAAQEAKVGTVRSAFAPEPTVPTGFISKDHFFKDLGLSTGPSSKSLGVPNTQSTPRGAAPKPANPNHTNMTAMSFRLPDMTGISDLVSSCNGNSTVAYQKAGLQQHVPIASIPIPEEERAIISALSTLQDQLAQMKSIKDMDDRKIQSLESEFDRVKQMYLIEQANRRSAEQELDQRKRSDSALGTIDDGSDRGVGSINEKQQRMENKFTIERMKLEGQIYSMQRHLEDAKTHLADAQQANSNYELRLENANNERASAISTLATAQTSNDQLRKDNKTLKNELARYRSRVEVLEHTITEERQNSKSKVNRYRRKVERLNATAAGATETARDVAQLLKDSREAYILKKPMKGRVVSKPVTLTTKGKGKERERSADGRLQRQHEAIIQRQAEQLEKASKKAAQVQPQQTVKPAAVDEQLSKRESAPVTRPKKKVVVQEPESESGFESDDDQPEFGDREVIIPQFEETTFTDAEEGDDERIEDTYGETRQDTVLSMVDPADVARLREEIAEERRLQEEVAAMRAADHAAKQKRNRSKSRDRSDGNALGAGGSKPVPLFTYTQADDVTIASATDDFENDAGIETEDRQNEEFEMFAPSSHRQTTSQPQPQVSPDVIVDKPVTMTAHEKEACTVCVRKEAIDECNIKGHSGNIITDESHDIPIPEVVPVSKRMPQVQLNMGWEEEATMRPSQAPKTALEKVLKQMQDEFEHLKIDYATAQAAFLNLDPSLGKRKRKAMTIKMSQMVEEMDLKADQIYALYDVAEAVFEDGDEEVEVDDSVSQVDVEEIRRSETRRARHPNSTTVG